MNKALSSRGRQVGPSSIEAASSLPRALVSRLGALSVLLLAAILVSLPGTSRAADDAGPSRYLAANCANCHGTQGHNPADKGISLAGLKAAFIVEQMRAFREGKRPATVMHQIARGYSDEQIQLLAAYFAKQVRK